ncbi:MAG TPA: hypothetical protein DCQ14_02610 [Firmicutes bacterium]|nr:hypothetical protein [Bacillota bacterium]
MTILQNNNYDYKGTVYCYCPETNKRLEMAFEGFEKTDISSKGQVRPFYGTTITLWNFSDWFALKHSIVCYEYGRVEK